MQYHEEKLTPRQIVKNLDKFIIGQDEGKKAVAIALRNRWRRQQVEPELREEITPKNIILIGPTGCGKTEIARRLARFIRAPFIKVEATKYTEVGYVGKDVESMIRDLVDISVGMVKEEAKEKVMDRARESAIDRVLDALIPPSPSPVSPSVSPQEGSTGSDSETNAQQRVSTREKFRQLIQDGSLADRVVSIETQHTPEFAGIEIFGPGGLEEMQVNIREMLKNFAPKKQKRKKLTVKEAIEMLSKEEASKMIDMEAVTKEAVQRVENQGIVFVDELDKICGRDNVRSGDVSREGVQRDILPIVEGCTVNTKYGMVKTDHILFVASGAFHTSKPSDLMPELQGRFPIRVELQSLSKEDFYDILTKTESSLLRQYYELLKAENLELKFEDDAIMDICDMAARINQQNENIGARRLHTVLEKLLEEVSFHAPDMDMGKFVIDKQYVSAKLTPILKDQDLSRYIL